MLPSLLLAAVVLQNCAVNTGLDPACPLTSVTASQTTTVLTSSASEHTSTLAATLAHGDEQFDLSLPLFDHLNLAGVGNAYGAGDLHLGYDRIVLRRKRVAHVLGLGVEVPTGAPTFTNGSTALTPYYAASYALGGRISLVALASYRFDAGGTRLPFAPRTQVFSLVPRAIVDLSKRGWYLAADIDGANVTGEERYQSYAADGVIGIAARHYAFSVTYREPIATYTWHRIFQHALRFDLSFRP